MTEELRRVNEFAKAIDDLRKELIAQGKSLVAQETLLKYIAEGQTSANAERGQIASEVRAYGIQLTRSAALNDALMTALAKLETLPARVENLEEDMAEVKPKVEAMEDRYHMARGAIVASRLFWLAIGAIGSGAIALVPQLLR